MSYPSLPNEDNVLRRILPIDCEDDEILPTAFYDPRLPKEISVEWENWNLISSYEDVRDRRKSKKIDTSKNRVCRLNIGKTREMNDIQDIVHDPGKQEKNAHSLILVGEEKQGKDDWLELGQRLCNISTIVL